MSFHLALLLLLVPLRAVAGPAHIHEARQGGLISLVPSSSSSSHSTSSSTTTTHLVTTTTTMSATSTNSLSSSGPSATSSASSQPSPAPAGINFVVQNMTTCTPGVISWNYNGSNAQLILSITSIPTDSTPLSRRGLKARQNSDDGTQQLVATNSSTLSWTWSSVNVTQGWYEIQGLLLTTPNISNDSAPFYVSNGPDVTCLTTTPPQPSSTTSTSSNSNNNTASIVGGVVGGVVGVIIAVLAGLYLWRRKRRSARNGETTGGIWGSLKSGHSSVQPGSNGIPVANRHFHAPTESMGAILQDVSGGKMSTTNTSGDSDEDAATTEEKLVSPATSSCVSPVDPLNTPSLCDRRVSTYTVATPTTGVASEASWSHSTTRRVSNQSLEQQAQRIRSSMETSARRRGERLSLPTLPPPSLSRLPHTPTLPQSKEEFPLSAATVTPVNRSISTGAVSMHMRRASRKPVPQYDPSLLEDANADSVSTFTAGAESSHSNSHSNGTGTTTGTHGTPPDLSRKASFGDGRPMHYLIPDMPLPQQEG